jgi:hypothetical protein
MNFGRAASCAFLSSFVVGLVASVGCSSSEAPAEGGAGGAAGVEGGVDATDGPGDQSASDAGDVSDSSLDGPSLEADGDAGDAGTCDDCGAARFAMQCASAEMACLNNAACAAIRNCVFTGADAQAPCTLGPSGAACVEACIQQNCTDSGSAALYRALDQCAYCSACMQPCASYCAGFSDAGHSTCGDM